jgi:hypothetical protein
MKENQPLRESDGQRYDRFWRIVGSGGYFLEGWELPRLTPPPEFSMPGAVDRAMMQAEALKSAEFLNMNPTKDKSWDKLTQWEKFDSLRHWVDWDGVSPTDRMRITDGHVDVYKLMVEYHKTMDQPELAEFWERQDRINQKRCPEMPADQHLRPWPSEIAQANRQKQSEKSHSESNGNESANGHDHGHSI